MVIGASSDIIQAFGALVRAEIDDERVDLLRSALTFARIEDPQLDIDHYVRRVDELAARVAEKIQDPDDPVQIIAALNDVLFQEEVFRGNTVDYYSPRNSFLHDV
ncbi:MAG TPA: transglutaminase family protein, partial [Candidatus Acidoferrales bacterium]|nr:transglutaminase family protein [Candidatus Acidoferrales bacterium]